MWVGILVRQGRILAVQNWTLLFDLDQRTAPGIDPLEGYRTLGAAHAPLNRVETIMLSVLIQKRTLSPSSFCSAESPKRAASMGTPGIPGEVDPSTFQLIKKGWQKKLVRKPIWWGLNWSLCVGKVEHLSLLLLCQMEKILCCTIAAIPTVDQPTNHAASASRSSLFHGDADMRLLP